MIIEDMSVYLVQNLCKYCQFGLELFQKIYLNLNTVIFYYILAINLYGGFWMDDGLIDKIKKIEGIVGAAIVSADGTIVESSDISESDALLFVFAGSTAEEVTGMFALGLPCMTIIQGSDYRLIIVKKDDGYIGVSVEPDANIKSVKSEIVSLV